MYIVVRPFRDVHGMTPAGSIVDPASVRSFRRHVREGHIVEVNDEQTFDRWASMLKLRYGKEIQKPLTAEQEAAKLAEQEAAKLAEQEAAKLAEQEAAKLAALATSTPVALATVAPDQSTTQQIIPRIKVV